MGRVIMEVILVQDFKVIRVDTVIKTTRETREVIINKGINSSNSRFTRATRSS